MISDEVTIKVIRWGEAEEAESREPDFEAMAGRIKAQYNEVYHPGMLRKLFYAERDNPYYRKAIEAQIKNKEAAKKKGK